MTSRRHDVNAGECRGRSSVPRVDEITSLCVVAERYVVRRNEFAVSFLMLSLRILTVLSRLEFVSRFTLKRHGALRLRQSKHSIVFPEEQR